jgi:hypothetical protein
MNTRAILLAISCALLPAGCDSLFGEDEDDSFSFTSMAVTFDSTMVDAATVSTQLRLQIDGLFILPHPCFEVRGDYRRDAGEILFTASAQATDPSCAPAGTAVQYHVNTFGSASGAYRVRVFHNITGAAPRVVADTTVILN